MDTAAESGGVLSFAEAYELVRTLCRRSLERQSRQTEEVPLLQGLGRVLASRVVADRDLPPFPRATRDGYAVRAADLRPAMRTTRVAADPSPAMMAGGPQNPVPALLRIVGQVKAGDRYDLPVAAGEAVEIMTGAAVPQGADAVVMVEHTERKVSETHHKGHEETQCT